MEAVELTRRQLLFAGASSLLAAGCQLRRDQRVDIPAAFVGPNIDRGHALRSPDAAWLFATPTRIEHTDVAILGGGVAGLSAAWRLGRAGVSDLRVLDAEPVVGGTSRSGRSAVTPFPWGAHYLPVPSQEMTALCELLREVDVLTGYDAAGRALCREQHLCRTPQERIFYKGRWYEGLYPRVGASSEDLRQFARFHDEVGRCVRQVDAQGRRAFALPRARANPQLAAPLDHRTMAQFLDEKGFTSWRLRWYVDYACRDDFGLRIHNTSAWAGMHYYAARLLHPDDTPPEVLTWPAGNGWLVERLAERLPSPPQTDCLVVDVRLLSATSPAPAVEVRYLDLRHGDPLDRAPLVALRARQAVFALPTYLRSRLLSSLRAQPPAWLSSFTYAPWLVANLTLRRAHNLPVAAGAQHVQQKGSGAPPAWDNVLVESPSLGYVNATHQAQPNPNDAPDHIPRSVWTYYLPFSDGDPKIERQRLLSMSPQAARDLVLADLSRCDGQLLADLERVDLFRWGHGMPRPIPGLLTSSVLVDAAAPLGPIQFAHTDLSGLALFEEAHHAGVRAAEAILHALDKPFERWA